MVAGAWQRGVLIWVRARGTYVGPRLIGDGSGSSNSGSSDEQQVTADDMRGELSQLADSLEERRE